MRLRVDRRDVPPDAAARRLGLTRAAFDAALASLLARGFPAADPDTHNFDLKASNRWCDLRHPHLFGGAPAVSARDARDVAQGRRTTLADHFIRFAIRGTHELLAALAIDAGAGFK